MVKLWGGRVARWGVLGLTALIVVVFFGRLIFQLEGRVRAESAGRQKAESALAVDEAKLSVRDNLHVTVNQPAPQVTVTVAPGQVPGQSPAVGTGPGSSRVVTVPMPFAVPGPTVTTTSAPSKAPTVTVTECPVVHLLFLCL